MPYPSFRTRAFGAAVAAVTLALTASSPAPTGASVLPRTFGRPVQRALPSHARARFVRRRRDTATTCTSNYGSSNGAGFFVGITAVAEGQGANVAGGENTAVLGGAANEACDFFDGIGAGSGNGIGAAGEADQSFIGGGSSNSITASSAMIGAGAGNTSGNDLTFIGAGYYGASTGLAAFVGAGGGEVYLASEAGASSGSTASGTDSFVGGGDLNSSSGNGAFIGAGDYAYAARVAVGCAEEVGCTLTAGNEVSGNDSFVGAGDLNSSSGNGSFIGAGDYTYANGGATAPGNRVSGTDSFVGAGDQNSVAANDAFAGSGNLNTIASGANDSVIVGGYGNSMTGQKAALGGGEANEVAGSFAVVPGGYHDEALGNESFAAGSQAEARYTGSFVWSDYVSGEKALADSNVDEFVARASGGVYFFSNAGASTGVHLAAGSGTWSSLSDRNAKTDIVPLDDASVLAKVAALPIDRWRYKTESGVRHVGPMAQDFYAAFRVGEDDRHITSIDEDGVALAAIKALNTKLASENAEMHAENDRLQARLTSLERRVGKIVESR